MANAAHNTIHTYFGSAQTTNTPLTMTNSISLAVLFSKLESTSDEGNTTPTFSTAPKVKIIGVDKERFVYITAITSTGFTLNSPGSVGDDLPIVIDIEIVSRSAAVTGATPSADFSSQVIEPMCTPIDIRMKHRRFSPDVITDARLMMHCLDARAAIEGALEKVYSIANLKGLAYASPVIPDSDIYDDPEDLGGNEEASDAFDDRDRAGFRSLTIVTDNTLVFTQQWRILFTSASAYTVTAFTEGAMGSGNTTSDFTSGNADVVIDSDALFGTFIKDNGFNFSTYSWYSRIVWLAKLTATALAMLDHYGDDQVAEQATAVKYLKMAGSYLKQYNMPDSPGGLRLPSLGNRSVKVLAMPYDVNFLGQNLTKITSGNLDDAGEKGERFGPFDLMSTEGNVLDIFGF